MVPTLTIVIGVVLFPIDFSRYPLSDGLPMALLGMVDARNDANRRCVSHRMAGIPAKDEQTTPLAIPRQPAIAGRTCTSDNRGSCSR